MSYFHLTRSRTRERTPEYDTHEIRPLARVESKKARRIVLSDDDEDGADDYPYSGNHRPSRALTIRNKPSELERFNIWTDRRKEENDEYSRRSFEKTRTYKYDLPHRHHHHHYHPSLSDNDEEREFRLKVQASFGRPKSSHHHGRHHDFGTYLCPSSPVQRKEKWVDEDWETRERSTSRERRRRDSLWANEDDSKDEETEKWSRYRRIKRTKTEDVYMPLSGWRRNRIVFDS